MNSVGFLRVIVVRIMGDIGDMDLGDMDLGDMDLGDMDLGDMDLIIRGNLMTTVNVRAKAP